MRGGGGSGQNISHLFGPGTTLLIGSGLVFGSLFGVPKETQKKAFRNTTDRSAGPIGGISESNPKLTKIDFYFKFPITANVF
jgi:hypothetical protein